MSHTPDPAAEHAELLHQARRGRRLLDAAAYLTDLDLATAYLVQDRLTAMRLAEGRRPAGYKLGYTSLAMREQMGIAAPNYGPLLDDMLLPNGAATGRFTQPRVEPEIGLVLSGDLRGADLTVSQVAAAVGEVRACLEIVDSVWQDYRFSLEQNTADGSSAAGVVVGPAIDVDPLRSETVLVVVTEADRTLASAAGAACGHPVAGVQWLCAQLAPLGRGLHAGDLVITGGLTAAFELRPGATITAHFNGDHTVSVSRPLLPGLDALG